MRQLVLDIETDSLTPTRIWIIVCRDLISGELFIFRNGETTGLQKLLNEASFIITHNGLSFDIPVINKLLAPGVVIDPGNVIDTLVVSRLVDANISGGHSLEAWGERLGFPKGNFHDFSKFSQEMEDYCIQDTLVTQKVFEYFHKYIFSPLWKSSMKVEHQIASLSFNLKENGFHFDLSKGQELLSTIKEDLDTLDKELALAFPPKSSLIREITPKLTKNGTLSRTDFRWVTDGDLTSYSAGCPFSRIEFLPFNPGSPKQVIDRLNVVGWDPYEKTDGHLDCEKELKRTKDKKKRKELEEKLANYQTYGWKISEGNLGTLRDTATTPEEEYRLESARKLVQRLTLQNRYTTLSEWINAVQQPLKRYWSTHEDSQRIHGNFNHIGAWTHRMSHSDPNMANIPTFPGLPKDRDPTFLELWKSKVDPDFRRLWSVPKGKILVGVDAESIQLRILAHYISDPRFTESLLSGKKEDKTDPHSMNQKALGLDICQTRDDAKTFIYAWLLGAGLLKVSQILKCSLEEAKIANENFLTYYPGLENLKKVTIPNDAAAGYFQGFDGRFVRCDSEHLMLAGYLQNGEACIMKHANILWRDRLQKEKIPFRQVNFVHDEWQTEVPDDLELALKVAEIQASSIKEVGEIFNLNCPMAGSYLSDHGTEYQGVRYSIGYNWYQTH